MKPSTTQIHENLKALGRGLGLYADGEVSDSLLRVRLSDDAAYRPRIDILWSIGGCGTVTVSEPCRESCAGRAGQGGARAIDRWCVRSWLDTQGELHAQRR